MTWRHIVLSVLGLWFLIAGWVLNPMHSNSYRDTAAILGAIVLALSVWALWKKTPLVWRSVLQALSGLWLLVMPFSYHFTAYQGVSWVTGLGGLIILATALWNLWAESSNTSSHGPGIQAA